MASEADIESEIQRKAPRLSPEHIYAQIVAEYSGRASDLFKGCPSWCSRTASRSSAKVPARAPRITTPSSATRSRAKMPGARFGCSKATRCARASRAPNPIPFHRRSLAAL